MSDPYRSPSPRYPWLLLAMLWIAFFLHQSGRQVYNALIPLTKADLGLSDVQIGLVATCFTLVYGAVVPFAGFLGDVWQKRLVVVLSLVVLSLGNLFTGFAFGMISLLLIRSLANGIGEAVFFPAASACVGQYHVKSRGSALAILQTALYASAILSGWAGGWLGKTYGWRSAFYVSGAAGLFFAGMVFLLMRNDEQDAHRSHAEAQNTDRPTALVKPRPGETFRALAHCPALYFFSLAFGAQVFVGFGYRMWMPTHLHEVYGLELDQAAFHSTFYCFLLAFFGILTGARLSDRLARRHPRVRLVIQAAGLTIAGPALIVMAWANSPAMIYACLGFYGFFRGIYESNMFATLYDSVAPRYRSSAGGIMLAVGFGLGAFSSVILGAIKQYAGLEWGWVLLGVLYGGAGLMLFATSPWVKHFEAAE